MRIDIEPGVYVVAVSGGVDSMVLMDLLRKQPELKLVVAHFDHGIRHDSSLDRQLVQEYADKHKLPFVYQDGQLDPKTSEAKARQARYEFLRKVRTACGARAIVTAHHQDDLLETAIHNILRGTGRKGLSSLGNTVDIVRPLINIPKEALIAYAGGQKLKWREDPTNQDMRYTRNYIRHRLLSKFGERQKAELLAHIIHASQLDHQIENQISNHLHIQSSPTTLNRLSFILLSHREALEVMAAWLRNNNVRQFDKRLLEKLVIACKTFKPGKLAHVDKNHDLRVTKRQLALVTIER